MSTRGVAIAAAVIAAGATITAALITSGQVNISREAGGPEMKSGEVTQPRPDGPSKGPGIAVTPKGLDLCAGQDCGQDVLILSTGTTTLKIGDIELKGESPASFQHDGACENQDLDVDDECALRVWFEPATAGTDGSAVLVIHQNLKGDPTFVRLRGRAPEQPTTEPTA
ncbi:hypothetical protein OHA25_13825 [Nonomuraea sp. NBC_00507]|uniref:hypothetical protein n=1 Tax=Nonomuraea sp. NBC_00507 TaxID=2976002 RepID=UPI002E1718FB